MVINKLILVSEVSEFDPKGTHACLFVEYVLLKFLKNGLHDATHYSHFLFIQNVVEMSNDACSLQKQLAYLYER